MSKHKHTENTYDDYAALVTPRLYSALDGYEKQRSDDSKLYFIEPSLTQQQFKEEANANWVMEQFARTGDISILQKSNPRYGDFTGVADYQESLNIVMAAQDAFMSLPANLRKKFNNDPAEYVAFVSDEANREEMKNLGMLKESPEDLSPPRSASYSAGEAGGGKSASGKVPAAAEVV